MVHLWDLQMIIEYKFGYKKPILDSNYKIDLAFFDMMKNHPKREQIMNSLSQVEFETIAYAYLFFDQPLSLEERKKYFNKFMVSDIVDQLNKRNY